MTIYRGANYPISRTLTSDGATPIAISSLDAIIIYVIHKYSKVLVQKYKYPNTVGYDQITIISDPNGQIRFFIQKDDLIAAQVNYLQLEYMLESTDVNYDSNTRSQVIVEDLDLLVGTEIDAE